MSPQNRRPATANNTQASPVRTRAHIPHSHSDLQTHTHQPPFRDIKALGPATQGRLFLQKRGPYTKAGTNRSRQQHGCVRHTAGAPGQAETAGDFVSSCILPLSPQVALPGRYSAGKAASGPCGHRKPEFTIDFCLSLGIRAGSSESEPVRSVGGPERRGPGAHRLETQQPVLKTRGC